MLAAVMFDLDGTLVDTDPLHFQAWRELFREHGREIDERFYQERVSGRFNPAIVRDHFPWLTAQEVDGCIRRKEARFFELATGLEPKRGLSRLLEWTEKLGLRRALVSNAPAANAHFLLSVLGLMEAFSTVVLAEHVAAGKPAATPYRVALAHLQVPAAAALAFEDSPAGIQAAVAAGIPTIGVASGHEPNLLRAAGALLVVPDFTSPALWACLQGLARCEPCTSSAPRIGLGEGQSTISTLREV